MRRQEQVVADAVAAAEGEGDERRNSKMNL